MIRRGALVVTLGAGLLLGACRPDDQRTDSVDPAAGIQDRAAWSQEMRMRVDAGNAAMRADSFAVARDHYAAATVLEPDVAAGWFGLYLAEQSLGNAAAAQVALERAQAIASGASLIREDGEGS